MSPTSAILDQIISESDGIANLQVVFIDIEKYSRRCSATQIAIIKKFTEIIGKALDVFSEKHLKISQSRNLNFQNDIIKLPTGDGVAIIFPFDVINAAHLSFSLIISSIIYSENANYKCEKYDKERYCDCHPKFDIRVGINEGKGIIYKDVNNKYNVAGEVINFASRVMGIVDGKQIAFSEKSYLQYGDIIGEKVKDNFVKYLDVAIKHGININMYQYIDKENLSINSDEPQGITSRAEMHSRQSLMLLNKMGPSNIYPSFRDARRDIIESCYIATDIKIFSIKGLALIGTDESILSTARINNFRNLSKIRILLMDAESKWITSGFAHLRKYESEKDFIDELKNSHSFVEAGFDKFRSKKLQNARSGVKYYNTEPYFRMIITNECAYISSYAENPELQVIDLPVAKYENKCGSWYSVFKRHFNDIWHNISENGPTMKRNFDLGFGAGGVVYVEHENKLFVILLIRSDGYYVLPKGHKNKNETLDLSAIREVAQEAGINKCDLCVEKELDRYIDDSFASKGEKKAITIFQIKYTKEPFPVLKADEDHKEAIWFDCSNEIPAMKYRQQATILTEFISSFKEMAEQKN